MSNVANLVHENSTTTGTGNFTLTSLNGKQSFNDAFGNGAPTDVFVYFIANRDAAEWEMGTGHMSDATTLVRDTVINSSNADSVVTFSAGTKDVTNDVPAADASASISMARTTGSTYSTVQHMQDIFHSAGVSSGGGITDDADGTVTVAAGTGFIRATDSAVAEILFCDWAAEAGANVALTDNDMNYVYVEYNSGSPQAIATITERTDTNTNIFLGTVYRSGTTLHITSNLKPAVGDHAAQMILRMNDVAPFARASGGVAAETTLSGVGRYVTVTAGSWWSGLTSFTTTALDTSAAGTFSYYYDDGAGGWTEVTSSTQIDNTQYDDGSGTLATLSNSKYGVHWIYVAQDDEYYVLYGTVNDTLTVANAAGAPSSVPPQFDEGHARLIAKVVILKSASTFTSIETTFGTDIGTAAASDHGGLTGLGDDDHTQYLLADGTRALAGAWSMGNFALTNVNIDSGTITGITDLAVADGGTGASSLTDGGILLGSGTGAITAMDALADGSIVVGDGTTDPVALAAFSSSTGNLLGTKGGTIGKQSIWMPASAMTAATTSGPASAQIEIDLSGTKYQNVPVLDFSGSADEYAHFPIVLPKGYNLSTISFIPYWTVNASVSTTVEFALEAVSRSDNESIQASWGTRVGVNDTAQSGAHEVYIGAESSALTIGSSPADGALNFFRVVRDVSEDNTTQDARLIGYMILYTIDTGIDD